MLYGTARESVRTIDSRLSGLMIFSSGLSAISIASLLAAVNLNPTTLPEGFFSIVLTLFVLYVLVQSCRCLLSAVAGLRRHAFREIEPESIISASCNRSREGAIRLMNEEIYVYLWNNWVTDRKVDNLEVAYVSFRNALWGAAALFLLVAIFAFWRIYCSLMN